MNSLIPSLLFTAAALMVFLPGQAAEQPNIIVLLADDLGYEPLSNGDEEVTVDTRKRAWARLLAKVYEVDPMVCPKCGAEMKVIAVIEDPDELRRILRHLVKIGRSPPGLDPDRLNQ